VPVVLCSVLRKQNKMHRGAAMDASHRTGAKFSASCTQYSNIQYCTLPFLFRCRCNSGTSWTGSPTWRPALPCTLLLLLLYSSVFQYSTVHRFVWFICRDILDRFSNMAACTVLFVLDKVRRDNAGTENGNKFTLALAFGPGISVEGSLLRLVS